jgi:hypothetical protein
MYSREVFPWPRPPVLKGAHSIWEPTRPPTRPPTMQQQLLSQSPYFTSVVTRVITALLHRNGCNLNVKRIIAISFFIHPIYIAVVS